MLDTITRDTTTATDLLGSTDNSDITTRWPYTEQQARAWFADHQGPPRPSVRTCAAAWSWHRSRAERLLARIKSETAAETPKETPKETPPVSRGMVPAENVDAAVMAMVKALAPPPAKPEKPEKPEKFFDHDSPDLIVPAQCAIAIYENPYGQLVIRSEDMSDDHDSCVIVSRPYLRALIERLDAMARQLGV